MDTIEGWLIDAGTTRRKPASLRGSDDGRILLETDTAGESCRIERLDLAALEISSRIANVPRRVTLADGRIFETPRNDLIDRLLAHRPRGRPTMASLEAFRLRLIVIAVALIAVVFVVVRWGVPLGADIATETVPWSVEDAIGRQAYGSINSLLLKDSTLSGDEKARVQTLFDELATASHLPPGHLRLAIRDGRAIGANALALPGGQIVVTDQMAKLAKDDDALAGVIAHEIGHVEARHGIRRLARAATLSFVMFLATGDLTGFADQVNVVGITLLDLSYSRNFEREADRRALVLLKSVGRKPEPLAELLTELSKDCAFCETHVWLASHPPTAERIRAIRGTP